MPIPNFQTIMLPLLQFFDDEKEHANHEYLDRLAKQFYLTDEELNEMIPSGTQTTFNNRIGWARTHLSKAGLLEMRKRTIYKITERGKQVIRSNPALIDMKFLKQFPEYVEFREHDSGRRRSHDKETTEETAHRTPEETLEDAYQEIRDTLAQELLALVKQSSPAFFERLVVELLVNMGYGGSRQEAAHAVGQRGDEGIDGIIDEDRLGLDAIYIQAKRWESSVGRPEIQKFVGALMGKKARKGIFITTSTFSPDAINYISNIDYRVVLIDGKRLAEYMIDYNVGVTGSITYQLKRADTDYFTNG